MNFIDRSGWKARPPHAIVVLAWDRIDTIFVHYTSMLSDQTGDPRVKMLGIQDYHQRVKGWFDVAYNWAFSVGGEILMGRGWQVQSGATGAENDHSVAFVFLGGDKEGRDDVTPKGRSALFTLIREAMRQKKNFDGGTLKVLGHTEAPGAAGATACPGAELMATLAMKGWEVVEPVIRWPRNFFLFASWYLGEGAFKKYGPHNLSVRPKQLPGRYSPKTRILMQYLRIYLKRRKK